MIKVHIKLKNNHLSELEVIGHADFYALDESYCFSALQGNSITKNIIGKIGDTIGEKMEDFFKPKKKLGKTTGEISGETQTRISTGSIPCASISILCKSFVDTIVLYAMQKKEDIKAFMTVEAKKKGALLIQLTEPYSDPMHVYRYAIEQMLIIGIQAVAKEYQDDVLLEIES